MNDQSVIETNNLWYGGEIPDRFKEQFPNNAVFLPVTDGLYYKTKLKQ